MTVENVYQMVVTIFSLIFKNIRNLKQFLFQGCLCAVWAGALAAASPLLVNTQVQPLIIMFMVMVIMVIITLNLYHYFHHHHPTPNASVM